MRKLTQNGFSALEGLLILVIIAIVGGTGYYVYNAHNKASDTLNAANLASQSAVLHKKKTTQTSTSPAKYLDITAWNVKFKIAPGDDGLHVSPVKDSKHSMYISNKAMDDFASLHTECAALNQSVTINRYQPGDTNILDTWTVQSLNEAGAKKIGDYYFVYSGGQSCFSNVSTDIQTQAANLKAALPALTDLQAE